MQIIFHHAVGVEDLWWFQTVSQTVSHLGPSSQKVTIFLKLKRHIFSVLWSVRNQNIYIIHVIVYQTIKQKHLYQLGESVDKNSLSRYIANCYG